jgi:hypothetical protein
MMKTMSAATLAGIVAIGLAQPAQASITDYTTITGQKSDLKAKASPTPAPGPVAKPNPGTHKAKPTPTPVPLIVPLTPIKKP